jgi:hypothetical protein
MKTLICFSLMAFLIFSGCSKVDNDSAAKPAENQLKSAPKNGTVSYYWTGGYYTQLVCDGVEVDYLFGNVNWHILDHYKNGAIIWSIYRASGTLTSSKTGEVFEIKESDKLDVLAGNFIFHSNLVGDKGSHYILSGSGLLVYPWTVTIDKANCPGN